MSELTIVLASNSPRRKQLLGWMGINFTIRPADIDETPLPDELPTVYVQRIAAAKARKMSGSAGFKELLLAADTTVADGKEILGKPSNNEEARRMLVNLRGRVHFVHTAIVVFAPAFGRMEEELCTTRVRMRRYTKRRISSRGPTERLLRQCDGTPSLPRRTNAQTDGLWRTHECSVSLSGSIGL
jgi:septum formation protein